MQIETEEQRAYTSEELARRCGCSVKTIIKHRERIPGAFRIGRAWRFDRSTIERKLITGKLW